MELTFHRMEYKKQRSKYNKPDGGKCYGKHHKLYYTNSSR